jgi:hypothetical protein
MRCSSTVIGRDTATADQAKTANQKVLATSGSTTWHYFLYNPRLKMHFQSLDYLGEDAGNPEWKYTFVPRSLWYRDTA